MHKIGCISDWTLHPPLQLDPQSDILDMCLQIYHLRMPRNSHSRLVAVEAAPYMYHSDRSNRCNRNTPSLAGQSRCFRSR
mmetsp:Transcript_12594/g.36670  ORF Transcript_12594/g.36670 Transcript_12594/m.36670 type:complete len:80 (+) Transcript_12594:321-560(+)